MYQEGLSQLEAVLQMEIIRQRLLEDAVLRRTLAPASPRSNTGRHARSCSLDSVTDFNPSNTVDDTMNNFLAAGSGPISIKESSQSLSIAEGESYSSERQGEKEGYLEKRGRRTGLWKKRWCVMKRPYFFMAERKGGPVKKIIGNIFILIYQLSHIKTYLYIYS
jgi:hypothetical protein